MSANPYVFIVGCLRSGTTMLRHVVDAHPQIAIVNETQWLPRLYRHRACVDGLDADGTASPAIIAELLQQERFSRLEVSSADLKGIFAVGQLIPYAELVSRVLDAHGRAQGKDLVGEKSPGYVRFLPILHELWPRAKIVHLIRDGRDVCLSLLSWKPEKVARTVGLFSSWQRDPIITAAVWWEWHVRLGQEMAHVLGPDLYREVRYEDLVSNPTEECARLCTFLGLGYDDAMLRFHERHHGDGAPPRRGPGLAVTPGLRNWRSEMTDSDIRRFEAAAGDILDELGCERVSDATAEQRARADEVRRAFIEDALGRRRPIPSHW